MNTDSNDPNEEITAGHRQAPISNQEWNRQTTVDARNVLQTQLSSASGESSQQLQEQRTVIMNKKPVYPMYVIHPEAIPSLNEVSDELKRRRHIRFVDPLAMETFEGDIPLETASSLQDEIQRAVQNRASQDENTDQEHNDNVPSNAESLFQPVTSSDQTDNLFKYLQQHSFGLSTGSSDRQNISQLFQRIRITGDFHDMCHIEDLDESVAPLLRALLIREKYMIFSLQSYPTVVAQFLTRTLQSDEQSRRPSSVGFHPTFGLLQRVNAVTFSEGLHQKLNESASSHTISRQITIDDTNEDDSDDSHPFHPPVIKRKDAFNLPLLPPVDMCVKVEKGIPSAYILNDEKEWVSAEYPTIDRDQFIDDYTLLSAMITDGPLKSFCYRRLQYLKSKFELHCLLNEVREWAAIKATPHRDFYNVRKVDAHIHAASSMNQKHLLRFMKKKLRTSGDMYVHKTKDGRLMTLKEVFDELHITAYDLSVDMLGVHADRNTFQRFDRFNAKYNPLGQSILREIFLKTDNYIEGVFFADLLKEVICDLEDSKYQHAEPRLSIYGKSMDEWDKLAKWAIVNTMYSANVNWMVQIPRLYNVYRSNGIIKNFQEFLTNLFKPLFDATINPQSHPELFRFMHHLTGFDSVDDETKPERPVLTTDMPYPEEWNTNDNPPYVYYLFYMYANIMTLNQLRRARGLNTFQFRPHCGEAGAVTHLVTAYMVAENIAHGLLLRKSPVLQYLFYLCQIGIAMSPLSNNSLFINYNRNPMLEYFERGLCVSLSTDDPMQFHFTKEPLMEEYSIAAQVWKLSAVDMCELARNSVLMSGFSHEVKMYWLGPDYLEPGIVGNDIRRTNVPAIRIAYRFEAWREELRLIALAYKSRQERKEHQRVANQTSSKEASASSPNQEHIPNGNQQSADNKNSNLGKINE
ncbi:unnamed protein product [Adineta ricciae]|uniref:AMP deaminase n=1 Tax=Adineta ricciae TaxID=249248 RepID=A0A814A2L4_ADIRI|nr:unnamed protein product [Adineta ricciae]CAF0912079.1 unnamed protein product [Adineta ricciae]